MDTTNGEKKKKKFRIIKLQNDEEKEEYYKSKSEEKEGIEDEMKENEVIERPAELNNGSVFEITQQYPPFSWEKLFCEKAVEELKLISTILDRKEKEDGQYIPEKINIFRAFDLCPTNKIKVVIFGQDPYHQILANGKPRAQGLSFSVSKDDEIPSSLVNIFKVIKTNLPDIKEEYTHGDLTSWAKQGILLLNTCLTVKPHVAKSHGKFWISFIKKVIKEIPLYNDDCIYVLWGEEAKSLKKFIEGNPPILESSHPSGFSFAKGFRECKHFFEINEILKKQNKEPIDWRLPY
jgi:uracil-DNA glycosylase